MLPKEIGPHEGVEFELIDQGVKHLALFGLDCLSNDHYVNAKRLNLRVLEFDCNFSDLSASVKEVIFYRDGYENEAHELMKCVKLALGMPSNWEELEFRIGKLLGYSEHDVSIYIEHFKRCRDEA